MNRQSLLPSLLPSRRAWGMVARCATALIGGYAAAAGIASLGARLLPIARVEATLWGMILSFLIFAALGLWAFHERSLPKVALVIWSSALLSAGTTIALGVRP
ncbi:ketohydroxyglutarate aldolase [Sphingobium sp.]|uniref:ketohydroxyglutarate aldolase n=1 Tax=Sphingobium sp. TaxID=1912891 RepID=UPI002CB8756C|nr:ketohydroxyglutarate aldolase [Sphingobium sp.]HUD92376.1 ketohydroxyglutarate aldolase [Sphingobium sp.]